MANFIGLVYATLKSKGIDTSGMSTDEAVAKFNELQGTDKQSKEKESAKKNEAVSKFKGEKETPKAPEKELSTSQKIRNDLKNAGVNTKDLSITSGQRVR